MILVRKLLFPFAILYGFITSLRNYLFDKGFLKSYTFPLPVIVVGNLSVGGTGKTPQIEYLIRLLSAHYKVATLSRGYKRKSKGFVLAENRSNAELLGDEPYQYHRKFPNILVAVDADRRNGIEQLLRQQEKPEVILLDDAYQHRKVRGSFYILLTTYDDLYYNDFMLPTGNLREPRSGANRANVILVTKCPPELTEAAQEKIKKEIGGEVPVFFSFVDYADTVYSQKGNRLVSEIKPLPKLLLAGIAKPKPFLDYLQSGRDEILVFPDHHPFSEQDIVTIKNKAKDTLIVTTEKDFVRLETQTLQEQLYYLPIKSAMVCNGAAFDQLIVNHLKNFRKE